ncbi:MAG: hypothetical protein CL917_10165 [Deltaproteobacteria bacterium]|nr:hypothetical protein [Deltaproteobacteria bacterium]
MYSILISILIGVVVGVIYTLLGFWKTWAMGIILGVLVAVGSFILISRRLAKQFEPRFLHAQKQLQAGANQLALKTLEELLPLGRWQIMLKGQIYAQMGILSYGMEQEDRALGYLEKSSLRASEARLALSAILFRRKQFDKAFETMDAVIQSNKKQMLPYNVYAWMLSKQGDQEKAIEQIRRCLKKEPSNEAAKDNLLRLQNNRKLNMKQFGMSWYALKLEKPPASMRQYGPGTHRGMKAKQRKQKRKG